MFRERLFELSKSKPFIRQKKAGVLMPAAINLIISLASFISLRWQGISSMFHPEYPISIFISVSLLSIAFLSATHSFVAPEDRSFYYVLL